MKMMKNNDVYRWEYNKKTLEELNHGDNGGTTYWCCSNIGIYKDGFLIDIFWGSSSNNKRWSDQRIKDKLILTFIANLDDLREVSKAEFNNYDDKDCINLNHSNTYGGYYIYKNAVPSLEKKRRVLKAHIEYEKHKVDFHRRLLEYYEEQLENLTIDTYMPYNKDVYIGE